MCCYMANNDHLKIALNPKRFPGMSTKMMAFVGYIIEAKFTKPPIVEMVVTSDGMLLARVRGDSGCNDFLGSVIDFKRNWDSLIHISNLGLSSEEVKYLEMLPGVMIRNYGD
jgi:hypothetical protein